jgi:hypothetical protein
MDAKTDMLYLASELTPVWGNDVARINAIGFNVLNASPQMMNGLTMKLQNTALTSLTGFTNSGWTTVYSNNYTITNTGWVFFSFSPFIWDGTSNILIEICYNDASINSNSAVTATSKPGLTWHQYQDLPSGSGCTDLNGGALQANRPNLSFVLNSIIDIKQIGTEIPATYSLKQNYPNPFNPVTKISFDIPKKAFVSLKVYDILGKEVARLVSEDKSAGKYILDFNASYLSSGIYFYKLEAGDFTETKRMVILK